MATNKPVKKTTSTPATMPGKENKPGHREFVFGRENYILMIIGAVVLALGFALMYGPADGDIFEFRRITLAPLIVLAGFVIEIFAIFKKPKH